jgi:hypothetical protein
MQESMIALGLEAGLAVLLCAALVFCWRLDRKLSALRAGQDGVRAAALELREAAQHAETAVRTLRATAQDAGRDLQARIDNARSMADQLGMNTRRSAGGRW